MNSNRHENINVIVTSQRNYPPPLNFKFSLPNFKINYTSKLLRSKHKIQFHAALKALQ